METITTNEVIITNGNYSWKLCLAPVGPNLIIMRLNENNEWIYNDTFQTVQIWTPYTPKP
jgi:hypothetical protein